MTELDAEHHTPPPDPPLACTLGAEDRPERMRRWQALADLGRPVAERHGHRLEVRFQPEPGVLDELQALADAERQCCRFVAWEVTLDGPHPVLVVSADPSRPDDVAPISYLFDAQPSSASLR